MGKPLLSGPLSAEILPIAKRELQIEGPCEDVNYVTYDDESVTIGVHINGRRTLLTVYGGGYETMHNPRDVASDLARLRVWSGDKDSGPPASFLMSSKLTTAIIAQYGIDVQALVDTCWQRYLNRQRSSHTTSWRPFSQTAEGVLKDRARNYVDIPGLPDVVGEIDNRKLIIDAWALSPDVELDKATVTLFETHLPDTVQDGLKGRLLSEVVSHPTLDRFKVRITRVNKWKYGGRDRLRLSINDTALSSYTTLADHDAASIAALQQARSVVDRYYDRIAELIGWNAKRTRRAAA